MNNRRVQCCRFQNAESFQLKGFINLETVWLQYPMAMSMIACIFRLLDKVIRGDWRDQWLFHLNVSLLWCHNGRDSVSNHQPHNRLHDRSFWCRSKKTSTSASLAFVWGIHRWPVNSQCKGPVTRKMFPFDDVIMLNWMVITDVQYWLTKGTPLLFIRRVLLEEKLLHVRERFSKQTDNEEDCANNVLYRAKTCAKFLKSVYVKQYTQWFWPKFRWRTPSTRISWWREGWCLLRIGIL